jgi:predicted N-acetyltransferase YhbS
MYEIVNLDESLIPSVTSLINSVYIYDSITTWSLTRATFLDPNFEPPLSLVAVEDGNPIGVAIAATRNKEPKELITHEHAWLKVLAVTPEHLETGLGDKLLAQIEDELRTKGYQDVRATDFAGWHLFPGINIRSENILSFLTKKDYEKVSEAVDYVVDLSGFEIPEMVLDLQDKFKQSGFAIRIPDNIEKERVMSWVLEIFGPVWSYETVMSFRHKPPGVVIAEQDGEIVGFAGFGSLELEWFGPLGVIEDPKYEGLSTILLYRALWEMKLRGQRTAVIPWASHLFFYSQLPNINKIKQYWILSKKL